MELLAPTATGTGKSKKPALIYPGGKNSYGCYPKIINIFPPHKIFIEACAGSAPFTRIMRKADYNYVIEIDQDQCDALRAPDYFSNKDVFIICGDAIQFIQNELSSRRPVSIKDSDVLIDFDPPYPMDTRRRSKRVLYKHSWSNLQHEHLCQFVLTLPFNVAIHSYQNPLYDDMLKSWNRYDFITGHHGYKSTESVYYNYTLSDKLHDYNFIGHSKTERQIIRRKQLKLLNKLAAMDAVQRNAMINAINQKFS